MPCRAALRACVSPRRLEPNSTLRLWQRSRRSLQPHPKRTDRGSEAISGSRRRAELLENPNWTACLRSFVSDDTRGGLDACSHTELLEDVPDVDLHCDLFDEEDPSDLLVGQPLRQQFVNLLFAL